MRTNAALSSRGIRAASARPSSDRIWNSPVARAQSSSVQTSTSSPTSPRPERVLLRGGRLLVAGPLVPASRAGEVWLAASLSRAMGAGVFASAGAGGNLGSGDFPGNLETDTGHL